MGSADVKWSQTENRGISAARHVTYYASEQYINSQTVLFGTVKGVPLEYPAGFHSYNFSCALPKQLPRSLSSSDGSITYKVKLIVEIPLGFDIKTKLPFTVVNDRDLNNFPVARLPVKHLVENEFFIWKNGPNKAFITVQLPRGGFVPREFIPVTLFVDNKTSVPIVSAVFKLMQVVSFKATSPRPKKREHVKLLSSFECPIPSNDSEVVEVTTRLKVPECPVTCRHSSCIQTMYQLQIKCIVKGMHKNIQIIVPIEVGTVPVWEEFSFLQERDNDGNAMIDILC